MYPALIQVSHNDPNVDPYGPDVESNHWGLNIRYTEITNKIIDTKEYADCTGTRSVYDVNCYLPLSLYRICTEIFGQRRQIA